MIDRTHELKRLQTRDTEISQKIKDVEEKVKLVDKDRQLLLNQIRQLKESQKELRKSIESFNKKDVTVSEHALVRFFERVLGYDLEAVRQAILNEKVMESIELLGGTGKFPAKLGSSLEGQVSPTFKVVVSNRVVATIET